MRANEVGGIGMNAELHRPLTEDDITASMIEGNINEHV
jgi:hypothetical protein